MKSKAIEELSARDLDVLASDSSDIKPMTSAMKKRWEAAKRTRKKSKPGRPPKCPEDKSRIVPVSIDPVLLKKADRYAQSAGISRSKLVAEGLALRLKKQI